MEAASDRVTPKEEALAYVHMVADASPGGSAEPPSAPPRDNALDQVKLFDMKKVRPSQFSGRPNDWQEFRFRLWILMEVVGIAALMKMAEDRGTLGEVTVEKQHETVQARSRLLYLLLSQSLGGKALTILRGVHHANGLEAWRRLTLPIEPFLNIELRRARMAFASRRAIDDSRPWTKCSMSKPCVTQGGAGGLEGEAPEELAAADLKPGSRLPYLSQAHRERPWELARA